MLGIMWNVGCYGRSIPVTVMYGGITGQVKERLQIWFIILEEIPKKMLVISLLIVDGTLLKLQKKSLSNLISLLTNVDIGDQGHQDDIIWIDNADGLFTNKSAW